MSPASKQKGRPRRGQLTLLWIEGRKFVDKIPVVGSIWLDVTKSVIIGLEVPVEEEVVLNQAQPLDFL